VALRVQSDTSAFYECQFDGYQDTLYAHTSRQYYGDCVVSGTIDFIFGNAQVVLQNCLIQVRRCMDNQQNIVTAQGRSAGGTVIHNCTVTPHPEFESSAGRLKTFLGRPWKECSRTLYIQSEIGGFVDPQGWLPWLGDFGLNTCYYAEVENHGPGASMSRRAKWRGVKAVTYQQAQGRYTVERFIQGQRWLPKPGVPYIPGLLPQHQPGRIHR
jgi:pectinesterase